VPQYLALCRRDLLAMQWALEVSDFERLRILGHNLKGSGGAYGFARLTELGACLEQAAKSGDDDTVRGAVADLKSFLDSNSR
jgi:HPt (histidine-containing phosphotransfer) domain-containing protein